MNPKPLISHSNGPEALREIVEDLVDFQIQEGECFTSGEIAAFLRHSSSLDFSYWDLNTLIINHAQSKGYGLSVTKEGWEIWGPSPEIISSYEGYKVVIPRRTPSLDGLTESQLESLIIQADYMLKNGLFVHERSPHPNPSTNSHGENS